MSNILKIAGAGAAGGGETDPNFNQTVLLLHGDGTNGAQNNTFLDSSTNNFTIVRNPTDGPNAPTQGTFSPFSAPDGRWSNYFDTEATRLTTATSAISDVGANNFSIECWVYALRQTNTYAQGLVSYGKAESTTGTQYLSFEIDKDGYLAVAYAATSYALKDPTLFPINQWVHAVVCRSGSTLSLFVNGTRVNTKLLTTETVGSTGNTLAIGGQWYENLDTRQLNGYLSNVRIVNGSSAYDATSTTLTVPTAPLEASDEANTSLLTCQSNRFVDNSSNGYTIALNGTPKVTPFSPFAPTATYDASVNGGSGYFDGTGDYLSVADDADFDFGTGDFTVSGWLYKTTAANALGMIVIDGRAADNTAGWVVYEKGDGTLEFWQSSAILTSSSALIPNQWNYFHISRSGSSAAMYINGSSAASATNTTSLVSHGLNIGAKQPSASTIVPWQGYLAEISVVKGTATSNAVPTAPTTAIANTSLLLNFTNAGIFDNTGKNNLETVADAQIDTTTKKYGTGSMEFDGTGDYLVCNSGGQDLAFGSGAFTVEFWVYINTVKNNGIIDFRPNGTASGAYVTLYQESGGTIRLYVNGADRITGASLSASTWYHIALTRSGTDTKLFVNGSQSGSTYTDSTVYLNPSNRPVIGHISDNVADTVFPLNGFIDDLRITKGVARYTTAFTPPTKAFADL